MKRAAAALLGLVLAGCATPRTEVRLGAPAPGDVEYRRDCAASALSRVAAFYRLAVPQEQLAARLVVHEEAGVEKGDQLVLALREIGLWGFGTPGSVSRLQERLQAGVAVVVQLARDPLAPSMNDFAVITAFNEASGSVVWLGGPPACVDTSSDFAARWRAAHFWMMAVCPPERAAWKLTGAELFSLARFLDAQGRFVEGDKAVAQMLVYAGRDAESLAAIGLRERMRGRPKEAERLYRQALAVDPNHARAANNLAFLLAERGGDLAEAERLARLAATRESLNPRVLDTLGFVLMKLGRAEEAVVYLRTACARASALPAQQRYEIGLRLVRALLAAGRSDAAALDMQRLRSEFPSMLLPADLSALGRPGG